MKSTDLDTPCGAVLPDAALIQTALCYLMTRYTLRPCSGLIFTIVHHLQMLLAHPDVACLPERRIQHWKSIALQQRATGLDGVLFRPTTLN